MAKEGVIRLVINAVDKFSSVVTGINSAIEIMGKSMALVGKIGGVAFDGIESALAAAARGGALRELTNQFENVAETYGQSGKTILKTIDTIAQGTVKYEDTIKLASKAIQTGLAGPEIEATLTYVKKYTESTGEDFNAMAEQVFQAFTSGRTAVLKQMGLFVKEGDSVQTVIARMRAGFDKFGDAGFNAGDVLQKISNRLDKLRLFFSLALNDAPALAEALNYVAEVVESVVDSFDSTAASQFFDQLLRIASVGLDAFLGLFGTSFDEIRKLISGLANNGGWQAFFNTMISYAKKGASFVVSAIGYISKALADVGQFVGAFMETWWGLTNTLQEKLAAFYGWATRKWAQAIGFISRTLNELSVALPDLVPQSLLNGIANAERAVAQWSHTFNELEKSAESGESIAAKMEGFGKSLKDAINPYEVAKAMDAFEQQANDAIGRIKPVDISVRAKLDTSAAQAAVAQLREMQGDKAIKDAARKAQQDAEKLKKQREKDAKEEQKRRDDALKKALMDEEKAKKLKLAVEQQKQTIYVRFSEQVPWPAALRDLVTVIIQSIIKQMAGERMPLALTTVAG